VLYTRGIVFEDQGAEIVSSIGPCEMSVEGCPISMFPKSLRCGRPLHCAPAGVDAVPVCLMHSGDLGKRTGMLLNDFSLEFETILKIAGHGTANFKGFVFPQLDLAGRKILATCSFRGATFTQIADFFQASFMQGVDFSNATFAEEVYFGRGTFGSLASFRRTNFREDAGFGGVNFTQDVDFADAVFTRDANFGSGTFAKRTDFAQTTFEQRADFNEATFDNTVGFARATFADNAIFKRAKFAEFTGFHQAIFMCDAVFIGATFARFVMLKGATFTQGANFSEASFKEVAIFDGMTFPGEASFQGAIFTDIGDFGNATFVQKATFARAIFTQAADFSKAAFRQDAIFSGAIFTQKVGFIETTFLGTADWSRSRFLEGAEFRRTEFSPNAGSTPSAVFALAAFSKPAEIVFDDVDVSRILFRDADVSGVWFTSSVRWGKRKGNRGVIVFDETVDLDQEYASGLRRNEERDYGGVSQIYQQLKKNYDARLDYWTANEFHFGEMEMRRLTSPAGGLLGRRWQRNLNLVAWYRYASDYGNSYTKPILWLLSALVLFAALFPLPWIGLQRSGVTERETYGSEWRAASSVMQSLQREAGLIGRSLLTAVDTATFQKAPEYTPAYPWGRILAIAEALLTSTLFALFLLAIRRQFRR